MALREDLKRMGEASGGGQMHRAMELLRSPGTYGILSFRFRDWLRRQSPPLRYALKVLALLFDHHVRSRWGIEIHGGASIGPGLVIMHYGGIFISSKAVIGKNFTIAHDVTIGTEGTGQRAGAPTIGDDVVINAGAKVNGKIRVGNGARIGPNAVVNRNVPDFALVHTASTQVVRFPTLYGGNATAQTPEHP